MSARATNAEPAPARVTVIWIDSREAIIASDAGDGMRAVRIESEVPAHHRATGHVRHDPMVRHGGGGAPQTAGDPRRLEHLARFLDEVAAQVPADQDVLVIGPGTVHERLAREIAERGARHGSPRQIRAEASPPLTRPQLLERARRASGIEPRRRTVGAYRWTDRSAAERSGAWSAVPQGVAIRSSRRRADVAED